MKIETTAIVCGHVFRNERPVKIAILHSDGVWQLVCGEEDHPNDCSDFEPVGFEHISERQGDLSKVAHMERGFAAEKDDFGGWTYSKFEE